MTANLENPAVTTGLEKVSFHSNPQISNTKECSNCCTIAKAFDCVDHNKLWKILQEMGITDYLTCLLRNVYASQEATVRAGHGTTRKEYIKALCCYPAYLTYMQSMS